MSQIKFRLGDLKSHFDVTKSQQQKQIKNLKALPADCRGQPKN